MVEVSNEVGPLSLMADFLATRRVILGGGSQRPNGARLDQYIHK